MSVRNLSAFVRVVTMALSVVCLSVAGSAQDAPANPTVKVGKYVVEMRLPADGIYAEEETDIEFRVTDASQDDPVQGAPPVVKAKVSATITMPAMPSMPKQSPSTHAEGVPGDYGVVCYFPHGGDYQVDLTITPPGDKAFAASFKVGAKDASNAKNRKPKLKPYTLDLLANPAHPKPGESVELTLLVRSRATKEPVTTFDLSHERMMHLIIVSKDLAHFAHEHPEVSANGKFTLRYAFPASGEYRLFADVAPHGAGAQVLMQPLIVTGASSGAETLKPNTNIEPTGGVRLALQTELSKLVARRTLSLTFSVKSASDGAPITDLEPYLGAMAHLILIHEDATTYVHSHPDESDPVNGHNGALTFLARFPKPGLYKGWVQFQRAGKVETALFVVTVKENT